MSVLGMRIAETRVIVLNEGSSRLLTKALVLTSSRGTFDDGPVGEG